jgi:hypothetical protein
MEQSLEAPHKPEAWVMLIEDHLRRTEMSLREE